MCDQKALPMGILEYNSCHFMRMIKIFNISQNKIDMKNSIMKIFILSSLLIFVLACEKSKIETESIYSNSFEKESDLVGWEGYYVLNNDTPISGGHQSIYISGGCVVPHVYYELGPFDEDLELTIQCWGKNLDNGGGVSLATEDYSSSIYLSIKDSNWNYYSTDSTLFCPEGKKLQLSLSSGGIISSAMLIDMIEIEKK